MNQPARHKDLGFLVIGAMKLASAVLLCAAGFGAFRLIDKDLGEILERDVSRLHLDPDNRLIHAVVERVSDLDENQLKAIGVGTFFYALLHTVEGTGLLLRRRWAGYVTVLITGSLLPVEGYELFRKVTAVRLALVLVNLGILAYLVAKLIRERPNARDQSAPSGPSSPS